MAGQKRPTDEPHTPTFPPPNPGPMAQMSQQRPDGSYAYPDPINMTPTGALPASPTASFHFTAQPYYTYYQAQPPFAPPQGAHSYVAPYNSSSPYALGLTTTSAPPQSVLVPNSSQSGPGQAPAQDQTTNLAEIASGGEKRAEVEVKQDERTSTDSSMVGALSRGPA